MKKLFAILFLLALTLNATAQDIFSVGYYQENEVAVAALYKNNEQIYSIHKNHLHVMPQAISCDSDKNPYWMVNVKNGNTILYTEVWKNSQLFVTTEGLTDVRIIDIYCQDDTLYYAGYYTNEDTIAVATVWKGNNFTIHWQLGDGVHNSYICDADVDRQTGIPYFCGYVIDEKMKAAVWKNQDLLYLYQGDDGHGNELSGSYASEISVDEGHVYTRGSASITGSVGLNIIWKDNAFLYAVDGQTGYSSLCAFSGDVYFGIEYHPQGWNRGLYKNNEQLVLDFGYSDSGATIIFADLTDIYTCGRYWGNGCIWKNFEVFLQPENCKMIYDMVEIETSGIPDDYYGFLYQPNHATITLDPNSSFGSEYGDFQAGFQYYPNGLLNMQRALSIHPAGEICDYDHTYWYNYDSDLHIIQQNDTYYGDMGAVPYQNHYVYEDGLLTNYTRHFDNYHEDELILEDSTTYTYDGQRRLQTEKRLRVNRYYKELSYEYHDNETVITTEGYSNGTNGDWIRLNKETRGFSEDSLLLTQQNEPYNDSATLVTYGYDEQGHRVSALTQKRYNGVWENRKLVQYHFNPYGCLTLAEIKTWQENEWINANRAIYDLDEMGYPAVVTFEKWDGETWVNGVWQADFYLYNEDYLKQQNDMLYDYRNSINKIEMSYLVTENPREPLLPNNSEWYYEILNDDGSVTYQHLEYAADTTIGNQRPKVIVRSNTQYDRDTIITEVTHEYIYDDNGIVYWWNKDLEEFTTLYDLSAEVGDEWEIKVGTESLIMHVDAVENYEYDGKTYRMLRVSDESGLFSGNIVSGVGHLTSFFPERLMNRDKGYRVTGLRCYWVEGNLILKINRDDCDAIYAELHNGIEEQSTDNAAFAVYPNPANNVLFVETVCTPSLPAETYRITNLMGQTVLSGNITAENQQINIEKLPAGMYFIILGNATQKFVVK